MKKLIIIILLIAVLAAGAWFVLRDGGTLEKVTEQRVEAALLANGLPVPLAECMAPKLTDSLSIPQLKKLERLRPEEGEQVVPRSTREAMARLRRVDDPEAVEILVAVGTKCGFELLLERI